MKLLRPPLALVVFDLDGTLVDSARDIVASLRFAFERVGVSVDAAEAHRLLGSSLAEAFDRIATARGFELSRMDSARDRFIREYRAHYIVNGLATTRAYSGVLEGLVRLRKRGHPELAVATTKTTDQAFRILRGVGLAELFVLVQGNERFPPKPDPALLLETARRAGVEPSHALAVGDAVRDIRAARSAGMRSCAVAYGIGRRDELAAERPDQLVETFAEVVRVVESA